jgi:hypothetical protein
VQEHPGQAVRLAEERVDPPLAVAGVADDLVREVVEVTADLVTASGADPRFQQRTAGEEGEAAELGAGRASLTVLVREGPVGDERLRRLAAAQSAKAITPDVARSRRCTGKM